MINNSLENINDQFLSILKSLNIDEPKQHNLNVKLDLHKKIKTIISIQTLEERKTNIVKYLTNIKNTRSYISLLSLYLSLLSNNTLHTVFMENKGLEIIKEIMKNGNVKEVSLCVDLMKNLYLNKSVNGEYLMLIVAKGIDCGKWEVLELIEDYKEMFVGGCHCEMVIYKLIQKYKRSLKCNNIHTESKLSDQSVGAKIGDHSIGINNHTTTVINNSGTKIDKSTPNGRNEYLDKFIENIKKSKYGNIFQYLLNKEIVITNCKNNKIEEIIKILEQKYGVQIIINLLENFLYDKRHSMKTVELPKVNLSNDILISKESEEPKPIKEESQNINKPSPEEVKKPVSTKKKIMFKKKEKTVNYINIKWNKINKKDTIFEEINVDKYKSKFTDKDLEYFIKQIEVKKVNVETKREEVIDPKKAYALNIALSRVKEEYRDVIKRILEYKKNTKPDISKLSLSENLINQLLVYFPTDQEVSNIRDTTLSDKYILFFKECINTIEEVRNNLKYMKLDILISNCNFESIKKFIKFFQDIRRSRYLEDLLGSILYLGQVVNKGSVYGNVEGFNILDIPSILTTRIRSISEKETVHILDIIKDKVSRKDVVIEVRDMSYDNLISDIREIKNLRMEISEEHKAYDEYMRIYSDMIEEEKKLRKRYGLENINDEVISNIISIYDL